MSYPGEVLLAASSNLVYASMISFTLLTNEEHLHLGLALLHTQQIRLYSAALPNNAETQARYQGFRAIHSSFEQMHRGIYERIQAINS